MHTSKVPIRPCPHRCLRFSYSRKHYQYWMLPFGLSSYTRVFTKMFVVLLARLRSKGIHLCPLPGHLEQSSIPGAWVCYQCQEKLLDSVHQNKSPGNVHRDFNNKDLPTTRNSAFHIVLELQEAHQSTGSSTVRPPSVMHRGHYMGTITQQAPSQLHLKGVRPFPRTLEGSSKNPDAGAQLLKIVVSPGQCP